MPPPGQQGSYSVAPSTPTQYQLSVPPPAPTSYSQRGQTGGSYSNMLPNAGVQMQYYSAAVTIAQSPNIRPAAIPTGHIYPLALPAGSNPGIVQAPAPIANRQPHRQQQFSQLQLRYLLAAYSAGMLAMETLGRRVHDDRPQAKYTRNPPYEEDVKWLLRISKHLGNSMVCYFLSEHGK